MNFILRRITSENRESNEIIGKSYFFIYDDRDVKSLDTDLNKSNCTPMSKSYFDLLNDYPSDYKDKIHSFMLVGNDDTLDKDIRVIPIYKASDYYIMTDGGKTFQKISRFHN